MAFNPPQVLWINITHPASFSPSSFFFASFASQGIAELGPSLEHHTSQTIIDLTNSLVDYYDLVDHQVRFADAYERQAKRVRTALLAQAPAVKVLEKVDLSTLARDDRCKFYLVLFYNWEINRTRLYHLLQRVWQELQWFH